MCSWRMSLIQLASSCLPACAVGSVCSVLLHGVCLKACGACLPCLTGALAMGRSGFLAVGTLAFTEFFGDSLIVLIVMWQELAELLPRQGARTPHTFNSPLPLVLPA